MWAFYWQIVNFSGIELMCIIYWGFNNVSGTEVTNIIYQNIGLCMDIFTYIVTKKG